MFARKVTVRLKSNSLREFTKLMDREILPWLRKQEGFLDLIILALTGGTEITTISFWDQQRNAEAYNSNGYPEVVKRLDELLDGTPYVKTFDVLSSTLQEIAPGPETVENLMQETDIQEIDLVQEGYRSCGTNA
jgi:hypothetical protein